MKRLLIAVFSIMLLAGTTGLLMVSDLIAAPSMLKDECDSSGKGSGDCDDRDDSSGHGGHDEDDDRDDEDEVAAQAARAAPQGALEIRIIDEQYVPSSLTVEVGQTVTVVNADDDEHTATSTVFDTGTLEPGESVTFAIDEPGTYVFICQFHAEMRGELVVIDSTGQGGSRATPIASPKASPASSPAAVTASPETANAAQTIDVAIIDFSFDQSALTIPAGTTVVWTNTGASPHTVTGEFGDSGILESGETYSFTFEEPGTFQYACQLHPQMVGQIQVE